MQPRPFRQLSSLLVLGALLTGAPPYIEAAQSPDAAAAATTPGISGWNDFVDNLRDLPGRLLAKLPVAMRNDPQIQQEVGRLALAALTSSSLDALGSDGDYPTFLPSTGEVLNVGQPNADTVYRMARITPGGIYRLRGRRGSLRIANIGQVAATPGPTRVYDDLNALKVDDQGRFDVILSSERPAGYMGDWWQLEPTTARLLLRLVKDDWRQEQDPTLSIERVDRPMSRGRTSAATLEQRLHDLSAATNFIAMLFVDHVEQLRAQGYVNKLKVLDVSQMGGLTGQFYYEGAYDLQDDEALIIEARVPQKCLYHSMILTNEIYETTNWYDDLSSLNDSQSSPDADGILRVVVSAHDPGVPNWLDTAGYAQGLVQGRWTYCSEQPIPGVRKVRLADVRKSLPASTGTVTAEQRDRTLRERRALLQQRPLW